MSSLRFGILRMRMLLLLLSCSATLLAQQGQWQSKLLENGLRLAYLQDSSRKMLHLGLTQRGGACLDEAANPGLAQVYEQLFFQNLPGSGALSELSYSGIYLSHKTLLESHFFGMSMPPTELSKGLALLAQGLQSDAWSDSSLQAARAAILPQIQAAEDAPETHLADELREELWQTFASRKPHAGNYADILGLNSATIAAQIAPYRHPANCLLAASGPESAERFFAEAAAQLEAWHPQTAGARLPKIEFPTLTQSIYFQTINEFASQPLIMMAWPVPQAEDATSLSQQAQLLCKLMQLKRGKMYQQLIDSALVTDYTWTWQGEVNPGQLLLYMIPAEGQFDACMKALQREIAQVGQPDYFTKAELQTAARLLQLEQAKLQDQSMPRLVQAGQAWALQAEDSTAQSTTLIAIQQFAQDHIQNQAHVAGLLLNSTLVAALQPDRSFHPYEATSALAYLDSLDVKPSEFIDPAILRDFRVRFEGDPLRPDGASYDLLRSIAEMLLANPDKRIYLNSYAEGLGDGVLNYQMSVGRAKDVRRLMSTNYGVPAHQLVIRAYGEAFPEFPDDADLRNRRLTFEYAPDDAQDNAF